MELDDWYPVPTEREDVGSADAPDSSSPPSDEEWPPMPALVPITRSVVPAGWYGESGAPGRLRYWDGRDWTRHVTPRTTPRDIPSLKPTRTADNRVKAGLAALGTVLLIIAIVVVALPHGTNTPERTATGVGATTVPPPSEGHHPAPVTSAHQPAEPPAATSPPTSAPPPATQPAPAAPAISPHPGSSINASSTTSKFVSDLAQVGDDETAIANTAGTAESSGDLEQVGTDCGTLSAHLGALQGDAVPSTLTPIEQTGLTDLESDLTDAANDCVQGVGNHQMATIIAAVNLFSSAGSLINQLDSQLS